MADLSLDDIIAKKSFNVKGKNMNQNVQKQFQGKPNQQGVQRPNLRPGFVAKQNRLGGIQQKRPFSSPLMGKQTAGPRGSPAQSKSTNLVGPGKGGIDARDMITIKNRIKIGDARAKIIQKRSNRGNLQAGVPPDQPQMNPRPQGLVPAGQFVRPPQAGVRPHHQPPRPLGQQRFQQPPRQPGVPFQQPRPLLQQPGPRMNPQRPPQFNQQHPPRFNQPQQFSRPQGPPFQQQQPPQFGEQHPPDFNPEQGLPFNQVLPDVDQGPPFIPDQGPSPNQGPPGNQQGSPMNQQGPPFFQPGPPFNQQGPPFNQDQPPDFHQQEPEFNQQPPPFGMDHPPHFGPDHPPQFNNQPGPQFRPPHPQFNQQPPRFNPPRGPPQFNRPPPPQMNLNQPPPNVHQPPPGMNQPNLDMDHQQMFIQPSGMNQPPIDFNLPPPDFSQPNLEQPDFIEPALMYEEVPEEECSGDLEFAPDDPLTSGGTLVEDTGSSLKITRSVPDVSFDGQNLTVTRRLPPRDPDQVQASFMDSGYSSNFTSSSGPVVYPPKKKFQPIPIQAPAPDSSVVKTQPGPAPIVKRAPSPIQAPHIMQGETPGQAPFARSVNNADIMVGQTSELPASAPPAQQKSRLKPPPCISKASGPTQFSPAQNRPSALSRLQLPVQNRGSALSRLQQPVQDRASVSSRMEQPAQNRASALSRIQQPVQSRGSLVSRTQQTAQDRVSALTRIQQPAQGRVSALTRIEQPTQDRVSALTRIHQPTQDRVSALTRIQQPAQDRGSSLSRIQQQTQDRSSSLSRNQQLTPSRGSALSRIHQQDQRTASSKIQDPAQSMGSLLRDQSTVMTSRQSSEDVLMTKRLAPHAPAPSYHAAVPHASVAFKAASKRPAPMSLSERFGSAGAGNPIPVITDHGPVKKRRVPEPVKTEPEEHIGLKEQYVDQEEQGVTVLSPLQGFRILVSNLHTAVTQDDIIELFGALGPLKRVNPVTRGQAEVAFIHKEHAVAALKTYHNRELDGQPMFVKLVTPLNAQVMKTPSSEDSSSGLPTSLRSSKPPAVASAPVEIPLIHKALFKTSTEAAPSKPVRFTVKL